MSCARPIRRPLAAAMALGLLLGTLPRASAGVPGESAYQAPHALPLLTAVRYFRAGQYAQAVTEAEWLLSGRLVPCQPRALLVLAASREAQGRYGEAREAYSQALALCTDPRLQQYVLEQMAQCDRGGPSRQQPAPPSAQLSAQRRADLARLEDAEAIETGSHFTVRSRNAELSRLVLEHAEGALIRVSQLILGQTEYPHSVEILIHATPADFAAASGDAGHSTGRFELIGQAGGYFRRVIHLTQLDAGGTFDAAMLDRVLPHELSHLVLTEFFGDAPCPLYLQEGLAMLAEYGEPTGRILLAGAAVATGQALPLEYLLTREACQADESALFYAQSRSLLSYLRDSMTQDQFHALLGQLRDGHPLGDALHRALAMPYDATLLARLETAWQAQAIAQAQILTALKEADGQAL